MTNLEPFDLLRRSLTDESADLASIMQEGEGLGTTADSGDGSYRDDDPQRAIRQATPSKHRKLNGPRAYRMPHDLMRSRRVGLSRTICVGCAAERNEGHARHEAGCWVPLMTAAELAPLGRWQRETTGPMLPNETSADVGWS